MKKHTGRRGSKQRRPDFFETNKLLIIALSTAGFALFCLVVLARLEEQPKPPRLPAVEQPSAVGTDRIHMEIEALFGAMEIAPDAIQRDLDQVPARYSVEAAFPAPELVSGFTARLQDLPGGSSVRLREANSLAIENEGQTLIIVHFIPPPVAIPEGPLMTIIMDDLGRSVQTAEVLASLPELVTFAVLPDEPHAAEVAEIAHAAGHEVLLHVPMEPQGYPAVNPGAGALFVAQDDGEIRRRFDLLLAKVPHVVGSNNHMGSRFTEDARALSPVMESAKEKGLFFIDSRTTGKSRVAEVAKRFGVPTMNRDVFLDNVADVEAITREIDRLVNKARRQGSAIGICHPYPETLEALRRELPEIRGRGVAVVPVAVLLQKQALELRTDNRTP